MNRNRQIQFRGIRSVMAASGLLFLAALAGCGGRPGPKAAAPEPVTGVQIQAVQLETVPDEVEAPGTVISVRTAEVAARVMGTVLRVAVREGDRVKSGQLLVELDGRELDARRSAAQAGLREAAAAEDAATRGVATAEAQAEVAQKTYERFLYLRDQKSVSPQEFDEVQARQRATQSALDEAKAHRQEAEAMRARAEQDAHGAAVSAGYAKIVAPFDGVVVRRSVDPGSMATPGTPLLVVEDRSQYRLEVVLDAADTSGLRRGSPARVHLDALPGRNVEGRVAELEAGADPASHTVRLRIDLPRDPALRSGLFGRAWFRRGQRRAIVLLAAAILERGQLRGVYVVDSAGIARLRLITLGQSLGDRREILSGLGEEDRVVLNPSGRELDGKRVEAAR